MPPLFTWIPSLDDSSTAFGNTRNDLCTTTEDHQDNRFTRSQQRLDIRFLFTGQTESLTVAVLTTQHDILTHGSNDDVGRVSHSKGFVLVGLLASIHLTMQQRIFPRTFVAHMRELGLYLFRPVTTTTI